MTIRLDAEHFESGEIFITIKSKPPSAQNKSKAKDSFKKTVQSITKTSKHIITSTCWVHIDYYCQHIRRQKNPSVYDIDNIIKPILDSLVGKDGVLVDDVIVDRVGVNWIDTAGDDYIEIAISYVDMLYMPKDSLVLIKSNSGWCLPQPKPLIESEKFRTLIRAYFDNWEAIKTEDDFYKNAYNLPIQNFVYHSKIADRGYEFIALSDI